ncbi:LD-carboxypeptidase [soil metagenome]
MRTPPLLAPGARVALVAPAGPVSKEGTFHTAVQQVRSFGWEPVIGGNATARTRYLAGTDEQRLHDLNAAFRDDSIDGIWCLRGGYGVMRILDGLDTAAMQARPRALIGFSDITALHAALGSQSQVIGYHGPHAAAPLTSFSRDSLTRAVVLGTDSAGVAPAARTLRPGRAEGRLVGGNLSLLAALCGTRFAPQYDGGILVIEDVDEATYRIDRMLRQLALAGALSRLAGIAYGQFTEEGGRANATSPSREQVLRETADVAGVPALAGIPIGHIDDQWTLPLGAMAELDADAKSLRVIR